MLYENDNSNMIMYTTLTNLIKNNIQDSGIYSKEISIYKYTIFE